MTDEQLKELFERQTVLLEKLGKKKDVWDKFSSLSSFFGSVLIAAIGVYFTTIYKKQEVRIAEAQTIEKFLPYLAGTDERAKSGAIISIAQLENSTLAAQLASAYSSSGTVDALEYVCERLNNENKEEDQKLVKETLKNAYLKRINEYSFSMSDPDTVLKYSERLLKLDKDADVYTALAIAGVQRQEYELAIEAAEKAIGRKKTNCQAYDVLGRAYTKKAQLATVDSSLESLKRRENLWREALNGFNQSIECSPQAQTFSDRGRLHFLKGESEHDSKEYDLAVSDYSAAIALNPTGSWSYWHRAAILAQQGKRDAAVADLQKAIYYDRLTKTGNEEEIQKELARLGAKYEEPRFVQLTSDYR